MYIYIYTIYTIYTICNVSPSIEYVPCDNEINGLSYTQNIILIIVFLATSMRCKCDVRVLFLKQMLERIFLKTASLKSLLFATSFQQHFHRMKSTETMKIIKTLFICRIHNRIHNSWLSRKSNMSIT